MVERDDKANEFARLDGDVHRRILERLNAARRPEDLADHVTHAALLRTGKALFLPEANSNPATAIHSSWTAGCW